MKTVLTFTDTEDGRIRAKVEHFTLEGSPTNLEGHTMATATGEALFLYARMLLSEENLGRLDAFLEETLGVETPSTGGEAEAETTAEISSVS